ncbi:hypothetical protein [uncultured Aureimonas sp.]|nr:hypothetical protein [uncultured Aureimonas sp.]
MTTEDLARPDGAGQPAEGATPATARRTTRVGPGALAAGRHSSREHGSW